MRSSVERLSTGIPELDRHLGGGLLPGTLTVIVGATGIGKTQLGLQFAQAGTARGEPLGIIFDMTARVDSQNHADYARRMFARELKPANSTRHADLEAFFDPGRAPGDYLHIFDVSGRRVTRSDLDFDHWHDWQAELSAKLSTTIAFFYGNFTRGVRRAVIDGIEPVDRPGESIQFELFQYIYHQILHKDFDWVARDLFRQQYRTHADAVSRYAYDHRQIATMLLYTSHETMLEEIIRRPLDEGDLLAGANTLIFMGKLMRDSKLNRGLFIAKHRGSACSDEILPFTIGERGLELQ